MAYFLLKTEPSDYSFDRLERDRKTVWDGVENALALKHMRSANVGDGAILYHTGDERCAVGTAEIVSAPYPDPNAASAKLAVFDVVVKQRLQVPVSLATLKQHPAFADSPLVKIGRLSVVPLSAAQWKTILTLGKVKI
jgi:predicted RNA-binding protein with PUA-like domain